MPDWIPVLAADRVTEPPWPVVEVRGHDLVVLRMGDGTLRAVPNRCPHLGQPLTGGIVTDGRLECPFHLYAYDLHDGRNTFPGDDADLALQVYAARERHGRIEVAVPDELPEQPIDADPPAAH